jgi:hypothetical protein
MEILAHPKPLVDVGSLAGYPPGKLMAGIGYEFWMNKFGSVKPYVEGTQESTVFLKLAATSKNTAQRRALRLKTFVN